MAPCCDAADWRRAKLRGRLPILKLKQYYLSITILLKYYSMQKRRLTPVILETVNPVVEIYFERCCKKRFCRSVAERSLPYHENRCKATEKVNQDADKGKLGHSIFFTHTWFGFASFFLNGRVSDDLQLFNPYNLVTIKIYENRFF